jgi:general L-amino acid transport system substrate-binding protein
VAYHLGNRALFVHEGTPAAAFNATTTQRSKQKEKNMLSLRGLVISTAMLMTLCLSTAHAAGGKTLEAVLNRGALLCTGHNGTYLGFAEVDDKGNWKGLDIELCRALATAVLGSPDKARIVPISWAQRFPALQAGDVDVIIKATTWSMSRDTEQGMQFSQPYFVGPTQFMVRKSLNVKTARELDGAAVCVLSGTSTERFAADYFRTHNVKVRSVAFEKDDERRGAYFTGRCDVMAGWAPMLAVSLTQAEKPDDHIILPDVLAVEPNAAAVRQGDDNWVDIINWMLSALLIAEQYDITSANVDAKKASPANPTIARLLGQSPGVGTRLGLKDDWAYNVIKQVGNYGETFDRTLGAKSPYRLPRGTTALIENGGVMYPLILD